MKYKVGDKVKIKSLDWYNENKDEFDQVKCGNRIFTYPMTKLCGKTVTITCVNTKDCYYVISEDNGYNSWTDDMIECKVEEEFKPNFKAGDRVFNKVTRKWVNIIEFDIETGLYIVRYDDGIQGRSLESELCEGMGK